jgi:adenylate cyclase
MARRVERRLTTVLAADVVEYSRLMRADEDRTLGGLTASREILDRLIGEHRGRIANTAGHSVVAEFPSGAERFPAPFAVRPAAAAANEHAPPARLRQRR